MVKRTALCLTSIRELAVFSAQIAEYFLPHEGQSLDLQVTLNL